MGLSEFIQILVQLGFNYIHVGWPFFFAHIFLAIVFGMRYWKTQGEVEELANWSPGQRGPANHTSARILQQFVLDCERHGEKGSLIPMTDYSDRLDAHIEHTIAALATRANLFLIVGVMGTFFALFQFAFEVQAGLQPEAIGRRLSQGLASAFPIGFIGLVLTMLAHLATDLLEGDFRRKAEAGVYRALATRSEKLTTVESALIEAVEPLRNLEATLSRTLQPVIEGFREQLRETHLIMAKQVQPLAEAIGRLEEATSQWNRAMETFAAAAAEHYRVMREAADVSKENFSLIKRSRRIFEDLDQILKASAGALTEASNRISAVPQILSDGLEEAMRSTAKSVESAWQESSRQVFAEMMHTADSLRSSAGDLSSASSHLLQLPADISQQVSNSLARHQEQFAVTLEEMQNTFSRVTQELTELAGTTWREGAGRISDAILGAIVSNLETMRRATEDAREKLAQGAESLITYAEHYRISVQSLVPEALRRAAEELQPYLSRLDQAIAVEYPRALQNLQEAVQTTQSFQQQLSEVAGEVDRIRKALDGAAEKIRAAADQLQRRPGVSAADSNDRALAILGDMKSTLESLPDRLVRSLARRSKRGEPVLLVREIPFWRKVQ